MVKAHAGWICQILNRIRAMERPGVVMRFDDIVLAGIQIE
jgi:hypothetical protein